MGNRDTRIVEMQFDNKDFEKGISTSHKSLERFKKDLDFDATSKSLEEFSKNVNSLGFDKLAANVQKLTDKFTGLGDIGEFVISKIRRGYEELANSVGRFVQSMTTDQLSAGMEKYESLNKSIQTIMAATGKSEYEVSQVLQRLNEYTDQTSYNFMDMASNIGKFTSVGIPLEQAEKQMEGIANWAARSGAGINEASRAMYNLSQAMGVGSLKLMDWKSIENANMATKEFKEQLIQAGVAAGTLVASTSKAADGTTKTVYKTAKSLGKQVEVDFQNLSTTLNKGWANTTVIGNTLMSYYYDDLYYANEEGMENLTDQQKELFQKMFSDLASVDTKNWTKIVEEGLGTDEIKQKLLEAAETQGTLTSVIDDSGKKIYTTVDKTGKKIEFTLDTFEKGLGGTWLNRNVARSVYAFDNLAKSSYEAAQKCMTFTDVINAWKDQISTGFMNVNKRIFGELSEAMLLFSGVCNKVGETIGNVLESIMTLFDKWEAIGGRDSLWGALFGELDDTGEDALYEGAYGILDAIKDIGVMIKDAFWDFIKTFVPSDLMEEGWEEDWADNAEFRMEFIAEKIKTLTDNFREAIGKVRDFFNTVPEGATSTRWEMIRTVIQSIFHVMSLGAQTIRGLFVFFRKIKNQLSPSIKAITDLFYSLTQGIIGTEKDLRKSGGINTFFSNLADKLIPVTNLINKVILKVTELTRAFFKWGVEGGGFARTWAKIGSVLAKARSIIAKIGGPIFTFFKDVGSAVSQLFSTGFSKDSMKVAGKVILDAFRKLFGTFAGYIPSLWEKTKFALSSLFEKIKGIIPILFNKIGEVMPSVFAGIRNLISRIFASAKNMISSEGDTFGGVLTEFFRNLFSGVGNLFAQITDSFGGTSVFDLIQGFLGNSIGLIADILGKFRELVADYTLSDLIFMFLGGAAIFEVISLIYNVKSIVKTFRESIESIGDAFGSLYVNAKANMFEKLTSLILAISGSIVILGSMNWQNALQGVIGVVAILGSILLFTKLMGKITKNMKASNITKMVAAITSMSVGFAISAVGMLIMVRALQPFASMNWEQIGKIMTGFAGILLIYSGFTVLVDKVLKVKTKELAKFLLGFALLSAGIGVMILALTPLSMFKWEQIGKMMTGLAGILLMLAGFSKIMGTLNATGVEKLGIFALGIGILVLSLTPLANLNWLQMAKMGVGLAGILLMLAGFSRIMGSIKDKGLGQATLLAIGIAIMVLALQPLANMDWLQMAKMGAGLAAVLLMLAGFSKIMGTLKSTGMFNAVLLSTAIVILMEALKPLANYNWESLGKMGAGLLGVLLLLAGFSHIMGTIRFKSMASVLILTGSIAILMEVLKPLVAYNWESLAKMGAGLLGVLLMLVGFSKIMGDISIKGMAAVLILSGSIFILMESLKPLAGFSWENLGKMALGLVALLGFMVLISKTLTENLSLSKAVSELIILIGFTFLLHEFANTMRRVKDIPVEKMLAFSASIVILAAAVMLMNKSIGGITGKVGKKIAMMAVNVIALSALMFIFSKAVKSVKDVDWKVIAAFSVGLSLMMISLAGAIKILENVDIAKGLKAIILLGAAIVAIGAAISLIMPMLSAGMAQAIDNLTSILGTAAERIEYFSRIMSNVDEATIDKAERILGKLKTVLESLYGMAQHAKDLNVFAVSLWEISVALNAFHSLTKDIKDPESNGAIQLLEYFKANKDSFAGIAFGNAPYEISTLGAGLWIFHDLTKDMKGPDDNQAIRLLQYFTAQKAALTTLDFGEVPTSVAKLGAGLWIFDDLTKGMSTITGGKKPAGIQLLDYLIEISTSMGDFYKLYAFGLAAARLGAGLDSFFDGEGNLPANIEEDPRIKILKTLGENAEGIRTLLTLQLGNLASQLTLLGGGMSAYALGAKKIYGIGNPVDELGEMINTPDVTSAFTILSEVVNQMNALAELNGDAMEFKYPIVPDTEASIEFGTKMAALAGGLEAFIEACDKITGKTSQGLEAIGFLFNINQELNKKPAGSDITTIDTIGIFSANDINAVGIAGFGLDLRILAGGLSEFVKASEGITGKTQQGLDAIKFLADINGELTDKAVAMLTFFDDKEISETMLGTLGTDLVTLSSGLGKFVTASEGVSDNTDKALDVLGLLTDINGKLTDDAVKAIKFFDANDFGATMLNEFGTDLVVLAEGLGSFAAVEVGDMGPALTALDKLAELNTKLTDAHIEDISKTLSAYLSPIDPSIMGSGSYTNYVNRIISKENEQQNVISVFSFGIKELGAALQSFVEDTKDQFTDEYKEPIQMALGAIEFFQEQYNLMPRVDRGLISEVAGYSKNLGDLSQPIKDLGPALVSFNDAISGNNYDIDKMDSAFNNIHLIVEAFAKTIDATRDIQSIISNSSDNYFEGVKNAFESGQAIEILGKQLNVLIKSLSDVSYSGIDGKSVVDNYFDLIQEIKGRLAEDNITDQDLDRVQTSIGILTRLVEAFSPNNYPQDQSVSNYINLLLQDIRNALYRDGHAIDEEVNDLITLFGNISDALNMMMDLTTVYHSPGEAKLKEVANDFGTFIDAVMEKTKEYVNKHNGEYMGDLDMYWYISDFKDLSEIIRNIAESQSILNSIASEAGLSDLGHSISETIASGISDEVSTTTVRNAMRELVRSIGQSIVSDPDKLFSGVASESILSEVTRNLVRNGKIMSNAWTDAFRNATPDDIMTEFENVVKNQDSGFVMSFEDLGMYMGAVIAVGIRKSSDIVSASLKGLFSDSAKSVMNELLGETLAFDQLMDIYFGTIGKDLDNLNISDYVDAIEQARNDESWIEYSTFEDIGYFISIGIAMGVTKGVPFIEEACRDAIKAAKIAAMDEAGEQSPSKVFAVIGGYLSEGMALGIANKENLVVKSAEDLADEAVRSAGIVISAISDLMTDETNIINPTIAPVLDMTGVESSRVTDMFSGFNGQIGTDYSLSLSLNTDQFEALKPIDYTDELNNLTNNLASLEDRVSTLSSKMDQMRVVLDSGALVGAIGPKVDLYLGQNGFYASRGMN